MAQAPEDKSGNDGGSAGDTARRRRKLSAIMMADVSGFSRMMGVDEDGTVSRIQEFHRRVAPLVERYEGRIVDTAGDSVFGEFDSVVNAMQCAVAIQADLAILNAGRASEERIEARIGVHLGDVIVEDYRVYGDGVNIAARLEPIADPGGICISEAVYQQVRAKLDVEMQDLGLRVLKNIQHPIRVFRVPPAALDPVPSTIADIHGGEMATEAACEAPAAVTATAVAIPPQPEPRREEFVERAPAGLAVSDSGPAKRWVTILDTASLLMLSVGCFLLLSPLLLFPTAGVFPTAGAILSSVAAGRLLARVSHRPGALLVTLGVGTASGALWTDWSRVTNSLFLLAGLIIAAIGVGRGTGREERKRARRDERERRRAQS